MLESTAKQMAEQRASSAVVTVLAPMCADKFRTASDSTLNMAELKKVSSWMQDTYIEKGGWVTFSGETAPERGVAQACANLLTASEISSAGQTNGRLPGYGEERPVSLSSFNPPG
jgi:hypothetical protein